jgi:quercetin dioxygenase-like cupin family protein
MRTSKLIRKDESVTKQRLDGKSLDLLFKSEIMEGILVELEPMTRFEGSYRHAGEEAIVMLEGEVEFTVGTEVFLCRAGDILWHRSDVEHTIRNPGTEHASYLTVLAPPSIR